ncbi:MAG: hypothetical protein ASARMPREDX12_003332 [Alectoria sarmentosa]|nr:MAG: hypothetical protein ASARMPREDX12_003332 [Alectoria sarmentosa]
MFSIIARNGEAAGNVGKYEPRQRICEDTIAWHSFNNAKLTANNTAAAVPMHTGNTLLLPDRTGYQNDSSDDIEAENDDAEKIKESFDPGATRVAFEEQSKQWAANSPATNFGYTAHRETIRTRDDYFTDIEIYHPSTLVTLSAKLRLLFVIYGSGWTIGNHYAKEMLLLRPIMQNFDFCIVSVNYRLAPEPSFPTP